MLAFIDPSKSWRATPVSEKHASPNDGDQHRSERRRVRQLGNQAECGSRTWTSLYLRHDLSPAPALAWPDRALRRTVWALTAQQLLRTPVCMVLRGTAADLAVLAGGKHARIFERTSCWAVRAQTLRLSARPGQDSAGAGLRTCLQCRHVQIRLPHSAWLPSCRTRPLSERC